MKKIVKIVLFLAISVSVTLIALYAVAGDRFMPWVKEEFIYVKINQNEVETIEQGGYNYTLPYISESGQKGRITFYAGGILKTDAYLQLDAKGNYVKSWAEVFEEDLPLSVKEQMVKEKQ